MLCDRAHRLPFHNEMCLNAQRTMHLITRVVFLFSDSPPKPFPQRFERNQHTGTILVNGIQVKTKQKGMGRDRSYCGNRTWSCVAGRTDHRRKIFAKRLGALDAETDFGFFVGQVSTHANHWLVAAKEEISRENLTSGFAEFYDDRAWRNKGIRCPSVLAPKRSAM